MTCTNLQRRRARGNRGFTLVEMVVVIAIILILSISGLSMMSQTQVGTMDSGLHTMNSSLMSARDMAVTRNTRTKLLISNDTSNEEDKGRFCVVVYEDRDDDGNTVWLPAGRGSWLPQHIAVSEIEAGDADGGLEAQQAANVNLQLPGVENTQWLAIEFASNGTTPNAGGAIFLASTRGTSTIQEGLLLGRLGNSIRLMRDPGEENNVQTLHH